MTTDRKTIVNSILFKPFDKRAVVTLPNSLPIDISWNETPVGLDLVEICLKEVEFAEPRPGRAQADELLGALAVIRSVFFTRHNRNWVMCISGKLHECLRAQWPDLIGPLEEHLRFSFEDDAYYLSNMLILDMEKRMQEKWDNPKILIVE